MTEDDDPDESPSWEELEPVGTFKVEKRPDWMTEMDVKILDALARGLTLSPSIIAENTGHSRASVSRRLNTLQAANFVEKVDRGKYDIAERGMEFLQGRLMGDEEWRITFENDDIQKRE